MYSALCANTHHDIAILDVDVKIGAAKYFMIELPVHRY